MFSTSMRKILIGLGLAVAIPIIGILVGMSIILFLGIGAVSFVALLLYAYWHNRKHAPTPPRHETRRYDTFELDHQRRDRQILLNDFLRLQRAWQQYEIDDQDRPAEVTIALLTRKHIEWFRDVKDEPAERRAAVEFILATLRAHELEEAKHIIETRLRRRHTPLIQGNGVDPTRSQS